jgi:hypothetical protein
MFRKTSRNVDNEGGPGEQYPRRRNEDEPPKGRQDGVAKTKRKAKALFDSCILRVEVKTSSTR